MAKTISEWRPGAYRMGDRVLHGGYEYVLKVASINSNNLKLEASRGFWFSGQLEQKKAQESAKAEVLALRSRVQELEAELAEAKKPKGVLARARKLLGIK